MLAVAGIGAALSSYENLVHTLGLEDQVRFLGFVPYEDLPLLLNSVDVFVMPSEAELLSIATLEAMATGRPLMVARARALPELVKDGENGYLFEPGDVSDAARCMAELADHPERWENMGAISLVRAREHSLDHILKQYEELYMACQEGFKKEIASPGN